MARARLSPLDLNKYSLIEGGLIELEGARKSAFRLVYDSTIEEGCVGLDPVGMKNVGRDTGGEVRFYKVGNSYAERAVFVPVTSAPFEDLDRGFLRARLKDYPVNTGDFVTVTSAYGREVVLRVGETFMEVVHEYPDITVHLTLFHAAIAEGVPKLLEHRDLRWITVSEIPLYEFCPADEEILDVLKRTGANPAGRKPYECERAEEK
jgi:hypothetical protein